ncbi:Nucleolar protein 16 [Halotydeus destructor]|nr:Nucleolar protein 16 [Halotydeus destructor]
MGKAAGVSRRRKKASRVRVTRRSALQKKRSRLTGKNIKVTNPLIMKQWDSKQTPAKNLQSMGLVSNVNQFFEVPKSSTNLGYELPMEDLEEAKKMSIEVTKGHVAKRLEKQAKKPQPKNFQFGLETIKFCIYMMEKHGEDYEAMSRDSQNFYQDSPGQIRDKITKMKKIPRNWNAYVKAQELVDAQSTTS